MDERSGQPVDSTVELVRRARRGDDEALERLIRRYRDPLTRWARHRLPAWARDLLDTDDLVQETLLKTVRNLESFEPEHPGALHAYMRRALQNRILDEKKRVARAPLRGPVDPEMDSSAPSPLEQAVGREMLERYERALAALDPQTRDAVIARIEYDMTYQEIADSIGGKTRDGVRMMIGRALSRMAREIGRDLGS